MGDAGTEDQIVLVLQEHEAESRNLMGEPILEDEVVIAALNEEWKRVPADYRPEPFRNMV